MSLIQVLACDLLKAFLKRLNITFYLVPVSKGFELQEVNVNNLIFAWHPNEAYIALGILGTHFMSITYFDSTNS
jgi:hypothetical protein